MTSQELLDNLVRDLTSVSRPRNKAEVRRRIEEYGDKRVKEEMKNIERIADMLDKDFDIGYCKTCNQMTNHLNNVCQKCK